MGSTVDLGDRRSEKVICGCLTRRKTLRDRRRGTVGVANRQRSMIILIISFPLPLVPVVANYHETRSRATIPWVNENPCSGLFTMKRLATVTSDGLATQFGKITINRPREEADLEAKASMVCSQRRRSRDHPHVCNTSEGLLDVMGKDAGFG